MKERKKLRRSSDRILGGVCSGIADYFDIDPVIVRLLWLISVLAFGFGVLSYVIAWIIIPSGEK